MSDDTEAPAQSEIPALQRFTVSREWGGYRCEIDLSAPSADEAIERAQQLIPKQGAIYKVVSPLQETNVPPREGEGDTHESY